MYTTLPAKIPRVIPSLYYQDLQAAHDWLIRAFGFEVHVTMTDDAGRLAHSELKLGDGMVMLRVTDIDPRYLSPKAYQNRMTQSLFIYVDNVDAHCDQARHAGAEIVMEPTTKQYGDRVYACNDLEGHLWRFGQRLFDVDLNDFDYVVDEKTGKRSTRRKE